MKMRQEPLMLCRNGVGGNAMTCCDDVFMMNEGTGFDEYWEGELKIICKGMRIEEYSKDLS